MNKKIIRRRVTALAAILIVVFMSIMLLDWACGGSKEGEATIRIPTGSSTAEIARLLIEEDVIDSEKDFLKKAADIGVDGQLKPGTYVFMRGAPLQDILNKLQLGLQDPESVLTVPEGFSVGDIASEVSKKTRITKNEYIAATSVQGRVLPLEGATGATDLEGFLFPSTYDLAPEQDAASLIDAQLEAFAENTAEAPWYKAAELGLTEYQVLVVASLVEREVKVDDERPLAAAVIYNRVAQGMKLEVDATVQYALGYWKQELTQADLEVDSLYNTRLYPGLPPGPICNPGLDSIKAALEPAAVDYLYYVATGDGGGHHFFTSSYDEFLEAQNP